MSNPTRVLLLICALSPVTYAQDTESCARLAGSALAQCLSDQQALRQGQLEHQLQQQEERQNQLDQQQRELREQIESMRLQNETLRKQLRETVNSPARSEAATDQTKRELKSWTAQNPWYGTDYGRTQFAMRYVKQLQQERPDLTGRALLDALSAKVSETFRDKN
jgi:septal ring factor EnvC (AmiA/AmiB activator)